MSTDLEIARSVTPRPIADVAAELGLDAGELRLYGEDVAKLDPALDCAKLVTRWRLRVPKSWIKKGRP